MNPIEQISGACLRGIASFDANAMWWESFWQTIIIICTVVVAAAITLIMMIRTMAKSY